MLNEERTQFQTEQDELLKTVLNLRWFNPWSFDTWDQYAISNDANLEIYITNVCNLNCEYCYLQRYPDLYPKDLRDPQLLLHNLTMLYEWILKENFHIPKIEFFSGEIWHTQFGWDILQLTYDYLMKGMRVDWFMIASNGSFVRDDKSLHMVQSYIDKFQGCGHQLVFSLSTDGLIIDQANRPQRDSAKIYDEESFYDLLFTFAKHNKFNFHPMIAAGTITHWIDNLKWWWTKFEQYEMDKWTLMTLEVRNDDWTDQAIQDYLKWLDFYLSAYIHEVYHDDIETFTRNQWNIHNLNPKGLSGYINWGFPATDTFMGCTIATDMTVRLGDLAICPCHRTAYDKYLYGHFKVENDQIVDITANNPQMAIKVLMNNINLANFRCDQCPYNDFCLKGCCGAQIEVMGDPWIPIPSVCNLFQCKANWLLQKYTDLGCIRILKQFTPMEVEYMPIQRFLIMYDRWEALKKEGKIDGMGKVQDDLSRRILSWRAN